MKVITNNHRRELESFATLPEDARADFDYVDDDDHHSPRFFSYRGEWYDSHEFTTTSGITRGTYDDDSMVREMSKWDGYQSDSFFSGTVLRYWRDGDVTDWDFVVAGTYMT